MRKNKVEYHVSLPFHPMQTWAQLRHPPFTSAFRHNKLTRVGPPLKAASLLHQIPSEQVHLNIFNCAWRLIIARVDCIIFTRTVMPFKFLFSSCLRHALDNFVGQLRSNARQILWINAFPEPRSQKVILQMANEKCLLWSVPGTSTTDQILPKKGSEKCYSRLGLSFL